MIEDMNEKYAGTTMYKIGEVAQRTGVKKTTVRYYEKRGLIPRPDRYRSGYRIFTERHINQINFIKRAKKLGFTLSEIKELLELRMDKDTSCSEIKKEAHHKYKDVVDKIDDLKRIKQTLLTLIDSCSGGGPISECSILEALEGDSKKMNNE